LQTCNGRGAIWQHGGGAKRRSHERARRRTAVFARTHRGIAVAALESWKEGDTMNVEFALLAPLVWGLGGLVAVLVLVRDRHASWEGPIRIETTGPKPLRPAA